MKKGFLICFFVITAGAAVASQTLPPTRTKKGPPPSRRNDNPVVSLPTGKDVPEGRIHVPIPAPPPQLESIPIKERPVGGNKTPPEEHKRPQSVVRGTKTPPEERGRLQSVVGGNKAPPGRRENDNPAVPSGVKPVYVPSTSKTGGRPSVQNDQPDMGILPGRDYPQPEVEGNQAAKVIAKPTDRRQNNNPAVSSVARPEYVSSPSITSSRPSVQKNNTYIGIPPGRDSPQTEVEGKQAPPVLAKPTGGREHGNPAVIPGRQPLQQAIAGGRPRIQNDNLDIEHSPASDYPQPEVERNQSVPVITKPTVADPPGRKPLQSAITGDQPPVQNDYPDIGPQTGRNYTRSEVEGNQATRVITKPTGRMKNDNPAIPTVAKADHVPSTPITGGQPPVRNDNLDMGIPPGRDYPQPEVEKVIANPTGGRQNYSTVAILHAKPDHVRSPPIPRGQPPVRNDSLDMRRPTGSDNPQSEVEGNEAAPAITKPTGGKENNNPAVIPGRKPLQPAKPGGRPPVQKDNPDALIPPGSNYPQPKVEGKQATKVITKPTGGRKNDSSAVPPVAKQDHVPSRHTTGRRPPFRNDNLGVSIPPGREYQQHEVEKVIAKPTGGRQNDNPAVPPGVKPDHVPSPGISRGQPPVRNDNSDTGVPPGRDYPQQEVEGKQAASMIKKPTGRRENDYHVVPAGRKRFQPVYEPFPPIVRGRPSVQNDNPDWGLPSGSDYPDSGSTGVKSGPPPPTSISYVPPSNDVWALLSPHTLCESRCYTEGYRPVCTIHGNEYDNDCYRDCKGEPIQCETACPCSLPEPVHVPDPCDHCMFQGFDPVCVEDEKQLQNECYAKCQGKTVLCSSHCPC